MRSFHPGSPGGALPFFPSLLIFFVVCCSFWASASHFRLTPDLIWTWGSNLNGERGDAATNQNTHVPQRLSFENGTTFAQSEVLSMHGEKSLTLIVVRHDSDSSVNVYFLGSTPFGTRYDSTVPALLFSLPGNARDVYISCPPFAGSADGCAMLLNLTDAALPQFWFFGKLPWHSDYGNSRETPQFFSHDVTHVYVGHFFVGYFHPPTDAIFTAGQVGGTSEHDGRLARRIDLGIDDQLHFKSVDETYLENVTMSNLRFLKECSKACMTFFLDSEDETWSYYVSSTFGGFAPLSEDQGLKMKELTDRPDEGYRTFFDVDRTDPMVLSDNGIIVDVTCSMLHCLLLGHEKGEEESAWAYSWGRDDLTGIGTSIGRDPTIDWWRPRKINRGEVPIERFVTMVSATRGGGIVLMDDGSIYGYSMTHQDGSDGTVDLSPFVLNDTQGTPRLGVMIPKDIEEVYAVLEAAIVCFGKFSEMSCNMHGECIARDVCACNEENWGGVECELPKCNGVVSTNEYSCSFHGSCVGPQECVCEDLYGGSVCQDDRVCFGESNANKQLVCSGHGDCLQTFKCTCSENYDGEDCSKPICFGVWETSRVCNAHGACESPGMCNCHDGNGDGQSYLEEWKFSGFNCTERINAGQFQSIVQRSIEIAYAAPTELIPPEMVYNFDCSRIVVEYSALGDIGLKSCWFSGSTSTTSALNIQLEAEFGGTEPVILTLVSMSDETKRVSVKIQTLKTAPTSIYYGIGFGFLGVVLCVTFVVGVSVALCLGTRVRRSRKTIGRFELLNDFDVLLQEQNAALLNDHTIDDSLIDLKFEDVELLQMIASGGSGAVVYEGRWGGEICAVKVFNLQGLTSMDFESVERELAILSTVHHRNVIRYIGCAMSGTRLAITMELCQKGDLKHFLQSEIERDRDSECLQPEFLVRLLSQIAAGMTFLHAKGILHRDLKPENVWKVPLFSLLMSHFG